MTLEETINITATENEEFAEAVEQLKKQSPEILAWLRIYFGTLRDIYAGQVQVPPMGNDLAAIITEISAVNIARGRVQAYNEIMQEFGLERRQT